MKAYLSVGFGSLQNDPQLMVAWESAKHVVTGPQPAKEEPPVEVKPAA